ncbi:MAG TPA: ABA4-like family protein [Actinoplanes sp.]|nr:ABA4-like family protein [Actinoplanes sp.]
MTGFLFTLTFAVAAPFWVLMIVLPRWSWSARIVSSPLIVLPVVLIYAALILPNLDTVFPAVASPTLAGVRTLLGTADGAAAGWAHMIAFDLFVGRWAWLDSRSRRIPALVMSPILLLTILLGPLGLLGYLLARIRWPDRRPAVTPAAAAGAPSQRLG